MPGDNSNSGDSTFGKSNSGSTASGDKPARAKVILPKVKPRISHPEGGPNAPRAGRGSKGGAIHKPGVPRLPGRNG